MATNKTQPTDENVAAYLAKIEPEAKRADAMSLLALCQDVTGKPAKMWGPTIVGCDQYHYKYESGREGDSFLAGFAFRKPKFSIYLVGEFPEQQQLLDKLGPYKMGKSCLYITKLKSVEMDVLRTLIEKSVAAQRAKYPDKKRSRRITNMIAAAK